MDIAKIRKKLREAGKKGGLGSDRPKGPKADDEAAENLAAEPLAEDTVPEAEEVAVEEALEKAEESAPAAPAAPVETAPQPFSKPEPEPSASESEPETEPAAPFEELWKTAEQAPFGGTAEAGGAVGEGDEELKESVDDEIAELLTFKLSDENYAFMVKDLEEILKPQYITAVPHVKDFVVGVTSLRGKIIPVIDLRKRLHLTEKNGRDKNAERILILNSRKGTIGAVVDRVLEVLRIPASSITEPPVHLSEIESMYIEAVAVHEDMFISIIRLSEALNFKIGTES